MQVFPEFRLNNSSPRLRDRFDFFGFPCYNKAVYVKFIGKNW